MRRTSAGSRAIGLSSLSTILFTTLLLFPLCVHSQIPHLLGSSEATSPSKLRAVYFELLEKAKTEHLPLSKTGHLWASIASTYHDELNVVEATRAYEKALPLLASDRTARSNYATALDNFGGLYLETGNLKAAEHLRSKAFEVRKDLGDPIELARSKAHLAEVSLAEHKFKAAEQEADEAYQLLSSHGEPDDRMLAVTDHTFIATKPANTRLATLVTLTFARCMQSEKVSCLQSAQEADRIAQKDFQPASLEVAHGKMALGFAEWKNGDEQYADELMQSGLKTMSALLGDSHPVVLGAMHDYLQFLRGTHRKSEGNNIQERIDLARSKQAPSCT